MRVSSKHRSDLAYKGRHFILLFVLFALFLGVSFRLASLTIFDRGFLVAQGEQRILHKNIIFAHRGKIIDATGMPIAISTAMFSFWINPQKINISHAQKVKLAKLLGHSSNWLEKRLLSIKRKFVYLKRHADKSLYRKIKKLNIHGLYVKQEFRRHYPFGHVMAQVLGFTDLEDKGQEGLELALDGWLKGSSGYRLVETDLYGNVVKEKKLLQAASHGQDIKITLDHRVQYIAYQHLQDMFVKSGSKWGSVVVLDPRSGNVLAMVNLPSYDPNISNSRSFAKARNRAVIDMYEPGSTIKPLAALAFLRNGYQPWSKINVGSGLLRVQGHTIHDEVKNLGLIDLAYVLKKSSNVGMAKFALKISAQDILDVFSQFGLGSISGSGFPGESAGKVSSYVKSGGFDHAAMSYGYGLAVTNLQLAHAYAIIANQGMDCGVHFIGKTSKCKEVIKKENARKIVNILHGVASKDGSGRRARVAGVEVAGKTGTALISNAGGYRHGHVNVSFVGMAPVDKPRLVVSVFLGEPKSGWRFGSLAAAPVFSKIVGDSLVLLRD